MKPQYELRMIVESTSVWRLEIWQAPSSATPRLKAPEHVASIQGPGLRIAENRLLKRLAREKIVLGSLRPGKTKRWPLDEELALTLGLLFRALAPMKNLDRIRQVAEGVEKMSREEAGYWLGMVMHREYPRRVVAALRVLLTTP
ncbi:MAG TPA: hypothetical protein VMI94_13890 [Bryobacteraceae bacterium]|nr:hypothetical protein [Bryobacteraceae bacterium]